MKITQDKKIYKFYNFMSNKRNIQQFMKITFKKYMNEEDNYILIGSICPYNTWTDCYILKSDYKIYQKLKKSNPEIFDREILNNKYLVNKHFTEYEKNITKI